MTILDKGAAAPRLCSMEQTEDTTTDMAKDRTDWAEDRTIMANERTFAGWMRTGMAAVAIALGLKAVFGEFEPTWAAKATSSVFIALACYIFLAARQQACATLDRMDEHVSLPKSKTSMSVTALVLAAGAILTGIFLWLLRLGARRCDAKVQRCHSFFRILTKC